ncbi:MAG: DegT/DnrJ/EryC1/StrS family aminotransferase [Planctomycetota bacterium]
MSQGREKIDYRPVQTRHTKEMEEAVIRVMRESSSYTMGEEVKAFEKEFAEFMGAKAAVGLANCTGALELSAVLCGVGPGDEVIVPGHTFVASAVPFARRGGKIVWADIDPEARVMSAETVRPLVTKRTKAIVVVHLMGLTVDMDPVLALAKERGIRVVEDCAQAPGARYKGKRVGSMGEFGCFSFHTQKNITTLGEGGMLLCSREEDAAVAKRLRWMGNEPFVGERKRYWEPAMANLVQCGIPGEWPYNFCLAEAPAAVGRLELRRLDAINANRKAQAKKLMDGLAEVKELSFQKVGPGCEHVYHMMPVKYDGSKTGKTRSDLLALMHEEHDIKCYVHYMPLYRFDLFKKMGCGEANCPASDAYYDSMYGYPWWTEMPAELIDRYIRATREVCAKLRG